MSVCVYVDSNQIIKSVSDQSVPCNDLVLLTQSELASLQSGSLEQLQQLLSLLFEFDPVVFAIVEGGLITAFLTSHFAGRMVRYLGKA